MKYEGIRPPFELEYFSKMNKKQAMQYFEWFMKTKEERFRILQEYISRDTDKVILDKTPESLIGLWEWFQTKISWEEKTREEIELELKGRPEWMKQIVLSDELIQLKGLLSNPTISKVLTDDLMKGIGFYLSRYGYVGLNYRNRLAHLSDIKLDELSNTLPHTFFYLYMCVINSVFIYYCAEKSDNLR